MTRPDPSFPSPLRGGSLLGASALTGPGGRCVRPDLLLSPPSLPSHFAHRTFLLLVASSGPARHNGRWPWFISGTATHGRNGIRTGGHGGRGMFVLPVLEYHLC